MMIPLIATTLLIIAPHLISGQSLKLEWLPNEMPNPISEPRKCGVNSNEESHVCDPNGLLGDHIGSFNWILKDAAYNSTTCPCSTFYCENYQKPKGYRIGLALVKRMKIQTNLDGKYNTIADQGQIFANTLKYAWNLGRCEEDIIIFYSQHDKVLAIHGGSTSMNKVTPYYRNLLSHRAGSRFSEGRLVEAINKLLYDLKTVLNCDNTHNEQCGLSDISTNGVSGVGVSISITILAFLISIFSFGKA